MILAVAAAATAFILGVWLTAFAASAAISRSQERMEKKVRYWQRRAMKSARIAEDGRPWRGW
jgi:hypothetical protein